MAPPETKQAAAVMIAWAEGKRIQYKNKSSLRDIWTDVSEPVWNFDCSDYRIAPEEKLTVPRDETTEIRAQFKDRDATIEALCLKAFGAKPLYASTTEPDPTEVEVWVHPDGRIYHDSYFTSSVTASAKGFSRRRATIHPENATAD